MATTQTDRAFNNMLNEYLPNKLLKETLIKRDWLLSTIEKDNNWVGGSGITSTGLVIPFKSQGASSITFGNLTATADVTKDNYVRGVINAPKEVWGTMVFDHRDLMEHEEVSEQNFLRILPDSLDDFMARFKGVVSTNLMNGSHFAKLVGAGGATTIVVDRPDRFDIGQKFLVDDDDSAVSSVATVSAIDMNTATITVDVSLTAYSEAQNAKCYYPGAQANGFTSLRGALLSSANGGDTTLHGQTKATYPFLQAINVNGGATGVEPLAINATNILEKCFEGLIKVKQRGKGDPTKLVMSYKNLGSCMKALENQKGSFNVVPSDGKKKDSLSYGWMEISIMSVTGSILTIIGVQECDDDIIYILDMKALKFYSNGFFRKRKSPSGIEYYEVREEDGFKYYVDMCLFGELAIQRPSTCGVIHGISY